MCKGQQQQQRQHTAEGGNVCEGAAQKGDRNAQGEGKHSKTSGGCGELFMAHREKEGIARLQGLQGTAYGTTAINVILLTDEESRLLRSVLIVATYTTTLMQQAQQGKGSVSEQGCACEQTCLLGIVLSCYVHHSLATLLSSLP